MMIGIVHLISSYYVNRTIYENHRNLTSHLLMASESGIEHYINEIQNHLMTLSKDNGIIYFGSQGKERIKKFYGEMCNENVFSNVSRVDKDGKLAYTYPENPASIGRDLLYQEHNKKLFKEKKMVVSRPFMAVQGYKAIAIAAPVFKGDSFDGAVTGLMPFDVIWEMYVKHIKPTENSFVILANADGGIIYSPEYMCQYDNVMQMMDVFRFEDSLSFDEKTDYTLQRISVIKDVNKNLKSSRFSLVRSSVKIEDDVWHILVYTPDSDIKSIYQLVFRSQTIFAYLIIFLLILTAVSFVKILNQKIEEKNRLVQEIFEEKKLSEGEREFLENIIKSIIKVNGLYLFVLKASGEIAFHNQRLLTVRSFYDLLDSSKKKSVKEALDYIYEKNRVTAMMIEIEPAGSILRILFNISSFSFKDERFIVLMGFEYSRLKDVSAASDIFSDSFKKWFTNQKMMCFIDGTGEVLASNRGFHLEFDGVSEIQNLLSGEDSVNIEKTISDIYENVNEVSLDFTYSEKKRRMTLTPIVNEFLKVEYISVEIN